MKISHMCCIFPADDSKVYLTGADTFDAIFQVDLQDPDSLVVRQRINRIIQQLGFGVGGPVLGRDIRMYITTFMKFLKHYMSSISPMSMVRPVNLSLMTSIWEVSQV